MLWGKGFCRTANGSLLGLLLDGLPRGKARRTCTGTASVVGNSRAVGYLDLALPGVQAGMDE